MPLSQQSPTSAQLQRSHFAKPRLSTEGVSGCMQRIAAHRIRPTRRSPFTWTLAPRLSTTRPCHATTNFKAFTAVAVVWVRGKTGSSTSLHSGLQLSDRSYLPQRCMFDMASLTRVNMHARLSLSESAMCSLDILMPATAPQ